MPVWVSLNKKAVRDTTVIALSQNYSSTVVEALLDAEYEDLSFTATFGSSQPIVILSIRPYLFTTRAS